MATECHPYKFRTHPSPTEHAVNSANLISLTTFGFREVYRPTCNLLVQISMRFTTTISIVCLLFLCLGTSVPAQSTDISAPAPVRSSEVVGGIPARDIGDSRLTDHFFTFTGTPGDLLITVESRNLNGDIDVFTATGLRPLLKFMVYEGSTPAITKSIYLRKREDLVLRIEARTPNDDEGTYRIRFGGSFEPIVGGPDNGSLSQVETPPTETKSGKTGRRVSSVGARIYEPPVEVVAAPTSEPERARSPARETTAASPRSRGTRGRTPTTDRRRSTADRPAEKPVEATEDSETPSDAEKSAAAKPEPEPRTTPARRRAGRRSTTVRAPEQPTPAPEPESGPRLVIETNDGTLVDRYMSGIRRVVVENGQVVVSGKDGKIQRIPLANVVRMSIAP